nr:DegQ family regulator [Metabacillus halosaccharovorans]
MLPIYEECETVNQKKIDEMTELLLRIEKELKESKQSLELLNKSIDKYDKYAFLNVS